MENATLDSIRTDGLVDRGRQRGVLEALREAGKDGLTKQALAQAIGGVSLRTVDRAIKLLETQGARIDRLRPDQTKRIRFRLAACPAWDEHVSSEVRLALRLASLTLSQSGTQLWQDKLAVIEALASSRMSPRDRRLFSQLQRIVRVHGGVEDPIESSEILEPLLRAIEDSRETEIRYRPAGSPEAWVRNLVPYALTHDLYSGGAFLLVWDPAKRTPLHLRLNRIEQIQILARSAAIPHPETMENAARYQIGGWTTGDAPFEVEARITGAHWAQSLKEAPPALPAFACRLSPDGQSAIVTFKANHENGPIRWILQFGRAAEVLGPETIRRAVAEHLELASEFYRATGNVQAEASE